MRFHGLLDRWRAEAELYRKRGLAEPAAIVDSLADELEFEVEEVRGETVNLVEGAKLSGYSASRLGKMVRSGRIPNAGRKNAPRIRIGDLPKKPGVAGSRTASIPVLELQRRRETGGRDVDRVDRGPRLHGRDR